VLASFSASGTPKINKLKIKQKETNKMSETWHYPPTHVEPPILLINNEAYEELEREEREKRAARDAAQRQALAAQTRPQHDHVAELTVALEGLEAAVVDYQENKDGKPNLLLINARKKVNDLQ
jgi:hypothetical protein